MSQDTPLSVSCFVRSTAVYQDVDDIISRVRRLEERGEIGPSKVTPWPRALRLTDQTKNNLAYVHYREFQSWADDIAGVSLEPAFSIRDRTTLANDRTEKILHLPVVCVAIYHEDDELVCVAPHSHTTGPYTVGSALSDLPILSQHVSPEDTQSPPTDSVERPVAPEHPGGTERNVSSPGQ